MKKTTVSFFLFFVFLFGGVLFGVETSSAKKTYLIAEALFEKSEYNKCLMQLDKTVEALGKTLIRSQFRPEISQTAKML